eukprot:SAG22_NODE_3_length_48349_cov_158.681180_31_plen_141_part_00
MAAAPGTRPALEQAEANMTGLVACLQPTRGQILTVTEFIWNTPDAYRSLWTFLSKHDLVGTVEVGGMCSDDPAPRLFAEPRFLRPRVVEGSWWRIVDVAGALSKGRRYSAAARGASLTLEVTDDDQLCPWNTGTVSLARC